MIRMLIGAVINKRFSPPVPIAFASYCLNRRDARRDRRERRAIAYVRAVKTHRTPASINSTIVFVTAWLKNYYADEKIARLKF